VDRKHAYSHRLGESVTRSDRRRGELKLENSSPPLACLCESDDETKRQTSAERRMTLPPLEADGPVVKWFSALLELAGDDPHVVGAFVSPSGTGFKIIFRVPVATNAREHTQNFNAVRTHVTAQYNAAVDEAAKDVARLCFVSHDPEAFFRADAEPLDVCDDASPEPNSDEPKTRVSADAAAQGGRNNAAFKMACDRPSLFMGKQHPAA
jgi:hypothetical protein